MINFSITKKLNTKVKSRSKYTEIHLIDRTWCYKSKYCFLFSKNSNKWIPNFLFMVYLLTIMQIYKKRPICHQYYQSNHLFLWSENLWLIYIPNHYIKFYHDLNQMKLDSSLVAIVTGGASGLGEATVRHLASLGVKVVIADLNEKLGAALTQ